MLSLQYRSKYISKNWIERNTIINHHYKAEQLHYIAFHVSAPWSWEHGAWKFHNQDKLKYIFERQLLWGYLKGYFTFELMKKTSFKIDNRTSFIVSHSQKCRLWATWKQCSEPVGSQKQVQQLTRDLQKAVYTDLCQFQIGEDFSIYCNAAHGGLCQLLYCMLLC